MTPLQRGPIRRWSNRNPSARQTTPTGRVVSPGQHSGPPATRARRLTLTLPEAAEALGITEDTFRRFVLPDLRVIQASPRIVLVRVAEMERWAERHEGFAHPVSHADERCGPRAARP